MVWVLHFDGLCEPVNPGGIATYGFVVHRDGETVHEERGVVSPPAPGSTSNLAEYNGLVRGLEWLAPRHRAGEAVAVRGDSQLVVNQVLGKYATREENIVPLNRRARELLARMTPSDIAWVPREENEHANRLTEEAFAAAVAEHPEWLALARSQPMSGRQRAQMEELGLVAPDGMDRREAARLIDKALKAKKRAERETAGEKPPP